MNNIENTYIEYDELVELVGQEVIESRIRQISQEMLDFLEMNDLNEIGYVHEMALVSKFVTYGMIISVVRTLVKGNRNS